MLILGYDEDGNDHDIFLTEFLRVTRSNGLELALTRYITKCKKPTSLEQPQPLMEVSPDVIK